MTMTGLLPTLSELNRRDKIKVMHYLVTELEKDENILPPGVYPVWSPFDSDEAADVLIKALQTEQAEQK